MSERRMQKISTVKEMSYFNMLAINALVELLDERHILPKKLVVERIKELQATPRRSIPQKPTADKDTTPAKTLSSKMGY